MKKISSKNLHFVPASHEDPKNPAAIKKILYTFKDFSKGARLQMINWGCLPVGLKFRPHYHEDMDEVFIAVCGQAKIKIGNEKSILQKGDAVLIPMKKIHQMENIGSQDFEYVVVGVSEGKGGKTHVIDV